MRKGESNFKMRYYTIGVKNSINYKLPLVVFKDNKFFKESYKCFKIIIIEKVIGVFKINTKEEAIIAPQIICLKHTDVISLVRSSDLQIKSIGFYPEIVNERFNFENICNEDLFGEMDKLDLFLLSLFINSNLNIIGLLPDCYNEVLGLYDKLENTLLEQEDEYWPCRSRAILFELLYKLTNIFENQQKDNKASIELINDSSHRILPVISYIKNNYNHEMKIDSLVKQFSYNRTDLYTDFKKAVGIPINRYITRIRLEMACFMLRDTSLPVTEICYLVGFTSYQNFLKQFKKVIKDTPNSYRRNN